MQARWREACLLLNMPRLRSISFTLVCTSVTWFLGCGGNVDGSPDPGDTGGSSSGAMPGAGGGNASGQPSGGGSQGTGATTGAGVGRGGVQSAAGGSANAGSLSLGGSSSATGGAPGNCCLAVAVCNEDDKQLADGMCPPGVDCYTAQVCCSKILCARAAQCDAIPTCDPGDTPISGECPPNVRCYSRNLCGTTIQCVNFGGAGGAAGAGGSTGVAGAAGGKSCDAAKEPDRNYVTRDRETCFLIDYVCPESTQHFFNDCGCGCEQDASCPDWVDCMPGVDGWKKPDPLCSSDGRSRCPYTLRAKDGAPVSAPLEWSEVTPSLDPSAFNLHTIRRRVERKGDLLAPLLRGRGILPRVRADRA